MPGPVVTLAGAGRLITSSMAAAARMTDLVESRAPATEVALAAVVLRDLLAELDRLRVTAGILRDHGDERYADGVRDGIEAGRANLLAEQKAAAAEQRHGDLARLRVVRPRTHPGTGPHPVTRGA